MGGLFLGDIEQTPVDLDAYFERIKYSGPREPTLSVLGELHRLHPAAIPFEAMDVLARKPVSLAPADIDAKLIGAWRGGVALPLLQGGVSRRDARPTGDYSPESPLINIRPFPALANSVGLTRQGGQKILPP